MANSSYGILINNGIIMPSYGIIINQKEEVAKGCNNMDKSQKYYAQNKKSDTEEY